MATSDTPRSSSDEPREEGEPREQPPSYDADKEGYAGISEGALGDAGDVREARAFAEMIVDTVREGLLVLDLDLRVKAANESFYRAFRMRPEETVGRLVYDLGDGQWDIPELRTLLEGILPHEKAFDDYEVDHVFEGLGRRVMLLNARRLDDHQMVLLAIEDVMERRRGERELRQSEERFRLLVDNAREYAIFATDPERRITMWSPGAEWILGWSREEALGQTADIIFTPEDRAAGAPEQEVARARARGSALDERWHVRKDGGRFWATGSMVALREDGSGREGRVLGFAKILRDNTRRKAAEEERDALLDALARERARLRELNETLEERITERTQQVRSLASRLTMAEEAERHRLAEILHDDLQQQLFGLSVLLNLLPDTETAEERRELHARAAETLAQATALTRSLSTELSPPVLASDRLADLLGWLAEKKRERHRLDIAVEVEEPCVVPGYDVRVLLYRVLQEALFNVAKHAGTDRARVRAWRVAAEVVVEVEDEGAGFDPAAVAEEAAGAGGFGLVNVRERLRLAGGRLEVASQPGRGTRVRAVAPAGAAPADGGNP